MLHHPGGKAGARSPVEYARADCRRDEKRGAGTTPHHISDHVQNEDCSPEDDEGGQRNPREVQRKRAGRRSGPERTWEPRRQRLPERRSDDEANDGDRRAAGRVPWCRWRERENREQCATELNGEVLREAEGLPEENLLRRDRRRENSAERAGASNPNWLVQI